MTLVSLQSLLEGKKKRRTAYKSGRQEKLGFSGLKDTLKPDLGFKKKRRDKPGRLIARTPLASKTKWREW